MSTKKTFTPDEAAQIAVEYGRMRVNQIAKSLQELRDRELKKAIIKPHPNHSTGTTSGSGVEDVPPGKINPPGKNDALKAELCKECGKEHMDKACGMSKGMSPEAKARDTQEADEGYIKQRQARERAANESHTFKASTNKPGYCSTCRTHVSNSVHGMDKAMLKDSKGKEKDNGIVPGSVLPEDKKTEEMSHDGSGGDITKGKKLGKSLGDIHALAKSHLSPPGRGTNNPDHVPMGHGQPKKPHECPSCKRDLGEGYSCPQCGDKGEYHVATPKSDVKKAATPPMAMPPSGKNMNTHVPTSKPAGAMAKEVKEMVVHGSKAVAPPKGADYEAKQKGDKAVYVAKEELNKAGLDTAATQPARPGIFGRLGGGTKTLVPPPGIKTAGAGLHPAGGGPKPMTAMSATHQPPKTEVSLGSTQGGAPSLAAPTAPNNMPKSPMAAPAKPVASKGPNALGSIIGAPPVVAPASTKSLAPAPALKPAGMALEPAGAPPMKQLAPAPSKNAVTVNSKPKP